MLSEKADGKIIKEGLAPRVSKISRYPGESCNFCVSDDYSEVYKIQGRQLSVRICLGCLETIIFMKERLK